MLTAAVLVLIVAVPIATALGIVWLIELVGE